MYNTITNIFARAIIAVFAFLAIITRIIVVFCHHHVTLRSSSSWALSAFIRYHFAQVKHESVLRTRSHHIRAGPTTSRCNIVPALLSNNWCHRCCRRSILHACQALPREQTPAVPRCSEALVLLPSGLTGSRPACFMSLCSVSLSSFSLIITRVLPSFHWLSCDGSVIFICPADGSGSRPCFYRLTIAERRWSGVQLMQLCKLFCSPMNTRHQRRWQWRRRRENRPLP